MQASYAYVVVLATLACSGCATVLNDAAQPMKVEAKTASGQLVSAADCRLTNEYGNTSFKSGDTVQVRRSSNDVDLVCKQADSPDANGRVISRVNGAMFGNIILGGGVGAIVDHVKGTAYTYPNWIQLVFGKTLVFDRTDENEGTPMAGKEPSTVAANVNEKVDGSGGKSDADQPRPIPTSLEVPPK